MKKLENVKIICECGNLIHGVFFEEDHVETFFCDVCYYKWVLPRPHKLEEES